MAVDLARKSDWWEWKFSRLLGGAYATACLVNLPPFRLLQVCVFLVLVLAIGAIYTSILNEYTDLEDDARCGKPNGLQDRSWLFRNGVLALTWIIGLLVMWSLRGQPLFLLLYCCAWGTFSVYSARPFRLKSRGFWGALADAVGSELLPILMTVVAVAGAAGRFPDGLWVACLSVWSLLWGLRGIAGHQFQDVQNDRISGLRTWVVTGGPEKVKVIIERFCFPLEISTFLYVIFLNHSGLAWPFLLAYGLVEWLRHSAHHHLAIVVPGNNRSPLIFQDFYLCFFPLLFLCALAAQFPSGWLLLALHIASFPAGPRRVLGDFRHGLRRALSFA